MRTRILGWRLAPFPPFLTLAASRMVLPQDPSTRPRRERKSLARRAAASAERESEGALPVPARRSTLAAAVVSLPLTLPARCDALPRPAVPTSLSVRLPRREAALLLSTLPRRPTTRPDSVTLPLRPALGLRRFFFFFLPPFSLAAPTKSHRSLVLGSWVGARRRLRHSLSPTHVLHGFVGKRRTAVAAPRPLDEHTRGAQPRLPRRQPRALARLPEPCV